MITNTQVSKLRMFYNLGNSIAVAASKSGMCENTARKYLDSENLPTEMKKERTWRTRPDPFAEVWVEVTEQYLNI